MKLNRLMKEHYAREIKGIKMKEAPLVEAGGWRRMVLSTTIYLLLTVAALTPFFLNADDTVQIRPERLSIEFRPVLVEAAAKLEYMRDYFKTKGDYQL